MLYLCFSTFSSTFMSSVNQSHIKKKDTRARALLEFCISTWTAGVCTHLHHAVLVLLAIKLHLQDCLIHRVVAGSCQVGDGATGFGGQDDSVVDDGILRHRAKEVAPGDVAADLWGNWRRGVFPPTFLSFTSNIA